MKISKNILGRSGRSGQEWNLLSLLTAKTAQLKGLLSIGRSGKSIFLPFAQEDIIIIKKENIYIYKREEIYSFTPAIYCKLLNLIILKCQEWKNHSCFTPAWIKTA